MGEIEVFGEEETQSDGRVAQNVEDEHTETEEDDEGSENEREFREVFDGEAEVGIDEDEEDDESVEINHVGGENGEQHRESKKETIGRTRLFFTLDFRAEPKK